MKKIVLASAISALFAAPVAAFAQAKPPAVPTLDKVLEASGITTSGYIDAGYNYVKNGSGFTDRVFDLNPNSTFSLNQFGLTMAKQPKEGFGGLVNITVGRDGQAIHSFPETGNSSQFDVTQAYAQWAGGAFTVIGGKFTTLHGTEVIASTGNMNISRSILFGAVPFTHTGVRGTWAITDAYALIVGVNNGWDQLQDANKGKTLEVGFTANPIKPLNIALSGYTGSENSAPSGAALFSNGSGTRSSFDAVASWQVIDPLSLGIEFLMLQQENFVKAGASTTGKYSGVALYATWNIMAKLRGTLRVEAFDDKDGVRFGNPGTAQKFREGTVTLAYLPNDSFELRGEVRQDQADQKAFSDSSGTTSKSMASVAVSGIYKF